MEFTANWSTELLSKASGHGFPRSKPLLQLSATGPVSNEPIPTISTIPKLSATANYQDLRMGVQQPPQNNPFQSPPQQNQPMNNPYQHPTQQMNIPYQGPTQHNPPVSNTYQFQGSSSGGSIGALQQSPQMMPQQQYANTSHIPQPSPRDQLPSPGVNQQHFPQAIPPPSPSQQLSANSPAMHAQFPTQSPVLAKDSRGSHGSYQQQHGMPSPLSPCHSKSALYPCCKI
eukprot:CAMPEP_0117869462 /NCGR_PEP_ID=MMETSP0950-20121206/9259_1 /TAXON_ID=44440 /ORGANISM="Chattonella subsalsa, Strain CCMP2191" /LENGTH=228 /DNA_ID=CAMNT_0005721563 /DNA_START=1 /DNA_END=687 /DNA_ORIENTATION=-